MKNALLKMLALAPLFFMTAPLSSHAEDGPPTAGILQRLAEQSGVYNTSKAGATPKFIVDPTWPLPLPHSWLLGQVGGLYVDRHDHVWVYNRPRTLANDEAGLEKALPGVTNAKGQEANGLGQTRVNGFGADCCRAAPGVVRPTRAGWRVTARRKRVAYGPTSNTASMLTIATTSGSRATAKMSRKTRPPGPPTAMAATALCSSSTWTAISNCGSAARRSLPPATIRMAG